MYMLSFVTDMTSSADAGKGKNEKTAASSTAGVHEKHVGRIRNEAVALPMPA
jgi:hypothetical protein